MDFGCRKFRSHLLVTFALCAWAFLYLGITSRLWSYEGRAGQPAAAPTTLPAASATATARGLPTLVMLVHPHCPCSRASVEELAKLMAHSQGKLSATVLMVRPAHAPPGWEQTDLYRSAAAIPGVTVTVDTEGTESKRFGAVTSGQVLLYSAHGELLFAGGITESRGHAGDNVGRTVVQELILGHLHTSGKVASTPVYGCSLLGPSLQCQKREATTCRN